MKLETDYVAMWQNDELYAALYASNKRQEERDEEYPSKKQSWRSQGRSGLSNEKI